MATNPPLNRQQLAQFLPSHEAIKAFEALFASAQTSTPAAITDAQTTADSALVQAASALAGVADALNTVQGALLALDTQQLPEPVYTPPVSPASSGTMADQNANAVAITGGSVSVATVTASGLITATGGQIQFPTVQVPSANASVLDDYKEGTFAPVVAGATTAGVGTYTFNTGRFTKFGNVVEFSVHISWTAHTGTGNTLVTGLPFTSLSTAFIVSPVTIYQANGPIPGANKIRQGLILNNSSQIALYEVDQTTGVSTSVNLITPTGNFHISGKYFVA